MSEAAQFALIRHVRVENGSSAKVNNLTLHRFILDTVHDAGLSLTWPTKKFCFIVKGSLIPVAHNNK